MKLERSRYADLVKEQYFIKAAKKFTSENFSSSVPAPFIGRYGYPNVNVGVLALPEVDSNAWLYDSPIHWAKNNFQIPQIVEYRSSLVNSRNVANVKMPESFVSAVQEVGMASKPVDMEVSLTKKPVFHLNLDTFMAPTGPAAELKKLSITSNPKIADRVEKVVDDTDMLATDAVTYLHGHGFDENFLSKLLSVGSVGVKRKLVPTRWSITATDDMLGKNMISQIRDFPTGDFSAFFGGYLGNYYLILTLPREWSYELFEFYLPKSSADKLVFSTDHELVQGRKDYADNTAGGYYAARLAVTEKLMELKRSASVLAFRFITDEYSLPLGVWVVRSATRNSMNSAPLTFTSKEDLLNYAVKFARERFNFDLAPLIKESKLLQSHQKSLFSF